ncbi:MAG: hypothetical protein KGL17_07265 [Betaproteobacteria bacterium]|nr:hypothetical protein [Betaproteobacteria bacterium]
MADLETVQKQLAELQATKDSLEQRVVALAHLAGETEREKAMGMLRIIGGAMESRVEAAAGALEHAWHAAETTEEALRARLVAAVESKNWLDVAIHAGMLHARAALGE